MGNARAQALMTLRFFARARGNRQLRWSLVLLWWGVILYFSSQSRLPAAISSQDMRGEAIRSLLHAGEYGVLAVLLHYAVEQAHAPLSHFAATLALAALFAAFDEWHQNFIPNRDASWDDVFADWVGVLAGGSFFQAVKLVATRASHQPRVG
jgi:VanZ family protein